MKSNYYDIIRYPLQTEKTTSSTDLGKYSFIVAKHATKKLVKDAIEYIYKKSVKYVNMQLLKGKTKIFKGVKGARIDRKKATVTFSNKQVVDIFKGSI